MKNRHIKLVRFKRFKYYYIWNFYLNSGFSEVFRNFIKVKNLIQ